MLRQGLQNIKINSQKVDRKLALTEALPLKYDFPVSYTSVEINIVSW